MFLRYCIRSGASVTLKLLPFTQTSTALYCPRLFFHGMQEFCCATLECLRQFLPRMAVSSLSACSYRQSCFLQWLRYSHNLLAWWRVCALEGADNAIVLNVSAWCYPAILDVLYILLRGFAFDFVMFFFFISDVTRRLCTRLIAPRMCTYPSHIIVTHVLGEERDMFSILTVVYLVLRFIFSCFCNALLKQRSAFVISVHISLFSIAWHRAPLAALLRRLPSRLGFFSVISFCYCCGHPVDVTKWLVCRNRIGNAMLLNRSKLELNNIRAVKIEMQRTRQNYTNSVKRIFLFSELVEAHIKEPGQRGTAGRWQRKLQIACTRQEYLFYFRINAGGSDGRSRVNTLSILSTNIS